jgi:hypothetical protein
MDAQRTPDLLSMQTESELICEKLLGWDKARVRGDGTVERWHIGTGSNYRSSATPSFTTWADAGLILEAFAPLGGSVVMYVPHHEHHWSCSPPGGRDVPVTDADTGPLAIRAAALEYIRSLP